MIRLLILILALIGDASGSIEIREDIVGMGEVQTYSSSGHIVDRARGVGDSAYGRILVLNGENASLFSGFRLAGRGSYMAGSSGDLAHVFRLSNLQKLNATSRISVGQGIASALFGLNGTGKLRESVLAPGDKGRMVELAGTYVSGEFAVNSSSRSGA